MRGGPRTELLFLGASAALFAVGFATPLWQRPDFEPGPRREGVLRVVTWNVGRGFAAGGRGLGGADEQHVADILRQLDADLCFLQEIDSREQVQSIRERLGAGWTVRSRRVRDGDHLAVAAQRGELTTFRVRAAGRQALGARYRRENGRELVGVGLHADAFSAERRNQQIGGTVDALQRRMSDVPHLLAGDLNLDLDLDKRRDLFTNNAYRDVETYNFVAQRLSDVARGRGSTAEPDRRLDYVFVSPRHFTVVDAGPARGRRRGDMDHDPVVADLRLR